MINYIMKEILMCMSLNKFQAGINSCMRSLKSSSCAITQVVKALVCCHYFVSEGIEYIVYYFCKKKTFGAF